MSSPRRNKKHPVGGATLLPALQYRLVLPGRARPSVYRRCANEDDVIVEAPDAPSTTAADWAARRCPGLDPAKYGDKSMNNIILAATNAELSDFYTHVRGAGEADAVGSRGNCGFITRYPGMTDFCDKANMSLAFRQMELMFGNTGSGSCGTHNPPLGVVGQSGFLRRGMMGAGREDRSLLLKPKPGVGGGGRSAVVGGGVVADGFNPAGHVDDVVDDVADDPGSDERIMAAPEGEQKNVVGNGGPLPDDCRTPEYLDQTAELRTSTSESDLDSTTLENTNNAAEIRSGSSFAAGVEALSTSPISSPMSSSTLMSPSSSKKSTQTVSPARTLSHDGRWRLAPLSPSSDAVVLSPGAGVRQRHPARSATLPSAIAGRLLEEDDPYSSRYRENADSPDEDDVFQLPRFIPAGFVYPLEARLIDTFFKREARRIDQARGQGGGIRPTMIVKPSDGSQGEGVYLIQRYRDLEVNPKSNLAGQSIVQKYISKPLLLNGLKFDLRIYVVLVGLGKLWKPRGGSSSSSSSCQSGCSAAGSAPPSGAGEEGTGAAEEEAGQDSEFDGRGMKDNPNRVRVFLCHEGLGRFCTQTYEPPDRRNLDSIARHLTNYSLQKKNKNFKRQGQELTGWDKVLAGWIIGRNGILSFLYCHSSLFPIL